MKVTLFLITMHKFRFIRVFLVVSPCGRPKPMFFAVQFALVGKVRLSSPVLEFCWTLSSFLDLFRSQTFEFPIEEKDFISLMEVEMVTVVVFW